MTSTTPAALTRRSVLAKLSTGAAFAVAGLGAGAALANEGTSMRTSDEIMPAADAITTDRGLLEAYSEWLFMERRILSKELYGDYDAGRFVPANTGASGFHVASYGHVETPPPSSRAATVLRAAGLQVGGFPQGDAWELDLPLLEAIRRRALAWRAINAVDGEIGADHPAHKEFEEAEAAFSTVRIHSLAGADAAARALGTAEDGRLSDGERDLLNELIGFLGRCVAMDDTANALQAMTWQRPNSEEGAELVA
jgi:hypothetical protein